MPNWCYQNLKIKGTKEQLAQFKTDMDGMKDDNGNPEVFTFTLFAAFPEILTTIDHWCGTNGHANTPLTEEQKVLVKKECGSLDKDEVIEFLDKKYGAHGWYDWNCNNWGTKWDAGDVNMVSESDEELHYYFQTAWSPATPAIQKASEKYPKLKFTITFTEESTAFAGVREFVNGVCAREADVDPALGETGSLNCKTFQYILAMATMNKEDIARIIGTIQNIEDDEWIDAEVFEKVGQAILSNDLDSDSDEFLDQLINLFEMEFNPAAEEIFGDDIFTSRESLEDAIVNCDDEEELERIRQELLIAPAVKNKKEEDAAE